MGRRTTTSDNNGVATRRQAASRNNNAEESDNDHAVDENEHQGDDDSSGEEGEKAPVIVGKAKGLIYNGKIWPIPPTSADRKENIVLAVTKLEKARGLYVELKANYDELLEKYEDVQRELQEAQSELSKYGKNSATSKSVKSVVEAKLFPLFKFITCKKKEKELATYVFKWIEEEQLGRRLRAEDKIDADHLARWIKTYGPEVTSYLNGARGDCTQRMLTEWKKLIKGDLKRFYGTGKFPTIAELKKCALRDINMENERERDIFEWYITLLFCKSVIKYGQSPH